jgi:hypothetical protein
LELELGADALQKLGLVHRDLGPVRALILEQCGAHGCDLVATGKARGGRVGLNEVAMQGWHVIHPPEGHAE